MSFRMSHRIEIFAKKCTLFFLFIAGLICLAMGVGLAFPGSPIDMNIFSIIGLLFFAYIGIVTTFYCFYRLLFPQPLVVLDRNGIYDNTSPFSLGFIPWSQIQHIQRYEINERKYVGLKVKNIDQLRVRNRHPKRLYSIFQKDNSGSILISCLLLSMSADDFFGLVSKHFSKYSGRHLSQANEKLIDGDFGPYLIASSLLIPTSILNIYLLGPLFQPDEFTFFMVIILELLAITILITKFLPRKFYSVAGIFGILSIFASMIHFFILGILISGFDLFDSSQFNPYTVLSFFGLLSLLIPIAIFIDRKSIF